MFTRGRHWSDGERSKTKLRPSLQNGVSCSLPKPQKPFSKMMLLLRPFSSMFPPHTREDFNLHTLRHNRISLYQKTHSLYRIGFLLYSLTKRKLKNDRMAWPGLGTVDILSLLPAHLVCFLFLEPREVQHTGHTFSSTGPRWRLRHRLGLNSWFCCL